MPVQGMKMEVLVFNERVVATKLEHIAGAMINTRPVMNDVADYLMARAAGKFQSEGRAGGGSWQRLTKKWLKFKASHGFSTKILEMHRPPALRDSVTKKGATGQILKIEQYKMQFGSSLPYAATHQFGDKSRGIPARPFLAARQRDRNIMRNMVREHIMKEWRLGGGIQTNA